MLCGWTTTSILSCVDVEKPPCFNHFEPFVHERRRIDRDLPAHTPVRVLECLCQRYLLKVFFGNSPKGPSRRGDDQFPDIIVRTRLQALEDSAVFAVHREDADPAGTGLGHDEFACRNEDFLVRQCDIFACADRSHRRHETGCPNDGRDGDVRVIGGSDPDHAFDARENAYLQILASRLQEFGGFFSCNSDNCRFKVSYLFLQERYVIARSKRNYLETVRKL